MTTLPAIETLHVSLRDGGTERAVGRLALQRGRVFFEYDVQYRAAGHALSPFHLPLVEGVQEERTRIFDGLHGVFADSLPDGWGRLMFDRRLTALGIALHTVTPLVRLAHTGARGMGALTYQPEVAHDDEAKAINLDALSREATKVLSGKDSDVLSQLTSLGGSSGGARPKVLVGFRRRDRHLTHGVLDGDADHEPWLIKFHALEDPRDMGNIELAYHHMARAAGLRITDARLFEAKPKRRRASRAPQARQFFGTQRFDRSGDLGRVHTHSFGGLVHLDHRIPGGADYIDLLRTTRALTRDQREVEQMFRLMVFNVLAHNRDDHAKNFSFLMDVDGTWRVSPAYDLTFSAGPGGEHWLGVAGEGRRPTSAHLHEVAKRADVTPRSAARIVDEVRSAVAQWRAHAKKAGVSAASAKRIAFALEALGFAPADQRMKRATKGTHG